MKKKNTVIDHDHNSVVRLPGKAFKPCEDEWEVRKTPEEECNLKPHERLRIGGWVEIDGKRKQA